MRRLGIAVAVLMTAQAAFAADPPILRGSYVEPISRPRPVWQGFYIGGHAGYSSHDFDFSKTTTGLQQFLVRESVLAPSVGEWQLLGSSNVRSSGFGGFAGYNWQWDDAIIGVEANYTHFSGKRGESSSSLSRTVANPEGSNPPAGHSYEYDVTLSGDASARVNDLLTLRARGGYAMGSFMPYAFAGLATAFVDIDRSATTRIRTFDLYTEDSIPRVVLIGDGTQSKAESQKNLLTFGFTAGIGFEYLVMPNIFVRAEYEYVQLPLAKDTIIQLNTGRVGLGAKF